MKNIFLIFFLIFFLEHTSIASATGTILSDQALDQIQGGSLEISEEILLNINNESLNHLKLCTAQQESSFIKTLFSSLGLPYTNIQAINSSITVQSNIAVIFNASIDIKQENLASSIHQP